MLQNFKQSKKMRSPVARETARETLVSVVSGSSLESATPKFDMLTKTQMLKFHNLINNRLRRKNNLVNLDFNRIYPLNKIAKEQGEVLQEQDEFSPESQDNSKQSYVDKHISNMERRIMRTSYDQASRRAQVKTREGTSVEMQRDNS